MLLWVTALWVGPIENFVICLVSGGKSSKEAINKSGRKSGSPTTLVFGCHALSTGTCLTTERLLRQFPILYVFYIVSISFVLMVDSSISTLPILIRTLVLPADPASQPSLLLSDRSTPRKLAQQSQHWPPNPTSTSRFESPRSSTRSSDPIEYIGHKFLERTSH